MINSEADIRPIGYGAMLVEGFVGLLALVAACTLSSDHYFAINTKNMILSPQVADSMAQVAREVGEKSLVGRVGGSVTLAVGMAEIFKNLPGMRTMMAYWYHFAIMFEALFILTTVDTGTRVARFILQEMVGRAYKPLGKGTWLPGVIITSFAVSYAWYYLLKGGDIKSIWPMFGVANQLLGVIALAIGTTYILLKSKKRIYAMTTFVPFIYLAVTVLTSAVMNIQKYLADLDTAKATITTAGVKMTTQLEQAIRTSKVDALLTVIMMALAVIICVSCISKWIKILRCPACPADTEPTGDLMKLAEGTEVAD